MNFYKKIIRNQETRIKLAKALSFLPDSWIVSIQYAIKTGYRLNLKDPKRYTEKIQWYKLNYRTPLLVQCADKYAVREYVEAKHLGYLLNDLYAVYSDADEIDFDSLPASFAMKANNGSGTNYFVKNKDKENIDELRALARKWLTASRKSIGGEWCYEQIPPKVTFEKLLPRDERNDIPDYKFFCFDGEPYCLYTMIDYVDDHSQGKLGFFDTNFRLLPAHRLDFAPIAEQIGKPKNFEKMVEYARILSKDFPHVRVDFFNIDGQIVFGELTFQSAGGYTKFCPDSFDFEMGDKFNLPLNEDSFTDG